MTDNVMLPDVVAYAFLRYGQAAIAYGENPLPRFGECLDEARSSLHAEIAAALAAEREAREAAESHLQQVDEELAAVIVGEHLAVERAILAVARVRELEARDRQVAGQLVRHWHEHAEACAECEPLRRDPDYVCREWRPTLDALCPARQAGEVGNG